jgi:RHS repeat-associated protein
MSVYFGGRRLWQAPYYLWINNGAKGAIFADRLGSNRYVTSSPASGTYYLANYYPYGDVPTGTASQDQVGFATYTQDSYTGLDYAVNRMYASTYGRFNTPDPYAASGGPSSPESWNRYSYAKGDPVNRHDPSGLDDCGPDWVTDASLSGPCLIDGYAWIDPSGALESACDQLIMAFGPVPTTDPACNAYAPIIPVAIPPQPPTPTCTLEVESFPLNTLGGGPDLHGSLYFASNLYGGSDDVIEGYTDGKLLQAAVEPGNVGPVGNVAGTGTDDGVVSGPQVCSALGTLEGDVSKINGAGIVYGILGPNSSSALRYMLQSLSSLLGSSWFSIPKTMLLTGYNVLLPGLE